MKKLSRIVAIFVRARYVFSPQNGGDHDDLCKSLANTCRQKYRQLATVSLQGIVREARQCNNTADFIFCTGIAAAA